MATFYSAYNNNRRMTVTTSYSNANRSTMTHYVSWSASVSGTTTGHTCSMSGFNFGGYNPGNKSGFYASGGFTLNHNKTTGYGQFSVAAGASVYNSSTQARVAIMSLSGTTTDVPTLVPYTAPSASASVSSVTRNSVILSWSSNATINYWWYSFNSGSTWTAVGNPSASSGSRTISGLSPGTAYTLRVRLRKNDGNLTKDSSNASFTTDTIATAPAPGVSSIERDRVTASFTPNKSIIAYRFLVNGAYSGSQTTLTSASAAARSQVLTGLSAGTAYNIGVRVWDGVHTGSYTTSGNKSATTLALATATAAPTIGAIARDRFTVSFSTNRSISGFNVSTDNGSTWRAKQSASGTSGSQIITGLSAGTAYNVKVRVYDGVHTGSTTISAARSGTTSALASIAAPSVGSATRDSFVVSFPAPTASISGYQVLINGSLYGSKVTSSSMNPVTVTGRSANTSYNVSVRIWDGVHTGSYTTSPVKAASTSPLALAATPVRTAATGKTISLNWSANASATEVQYTTNNGTNWLSGGTFTARTSGSFVMSKTSTGADLSPNTTYSIKFRVKDSVANAYGGASGALSTRTVALSTATGTAFNVGSSVTATVVEDNSNMYHNITLQYYNGSSWVDAADMQGNLSGGGTFSTSGKRTAIENSSPNSTSVQFRFKTESLWGSGGVSQGVHYGATFIGTIVDARPVISSASYADSHSNSTFVAFKGGSQVILRNISPIKITLGSVTGQKNATLVSYTATAPGHPPIPVTATGGTSQSNVIINIPPLNRPSGVETIKIDVVDSRSEVSSVEVKVTMMDYQAPQVINFEAERKFSYEQWVYLNLIARHSTIKVGTEDRNFLTGQMRAHPFEQPIEPWTNIPFKKEEVSGSWQSVLAWDQNTASTPGVLGKPYIADLDTEKVHAVEIRVMDEITRILEGINIGSNTNTAKMQLYNTSVGMGIGMVEKYEDRWEFGVDLYDKRTGGKYITEGESSIAATIYPVGSIYLSVNSTNPSTYFGGSWVSFGAGRMLVGVNTSDTDFNTVEKTGGSKTNTLATANLPAHTHTFTGNATGSAGNHSHTITVASGGGHAHTASSNSTGAHTHSVSGTATSAGAHTHGQHKDTWMNDQNNMDARLATSANGFWAGAGRTIYSTASAGAHTHPLSGTAASAGAHSHTITVASGGAHTHTASSNSTGAHTHTVSGSNANTGSGTAFNTVDPYITVYMWKRTA